MLPPPECFPSNIKHTPMKYTHIFAALLLPLLLISGCARALPDPAEILEREQKRVEYITTGQFDALSDMLASTLTYTHSNGTLDDKEYFMNTHRTEQVTYHSLEHDDLEVRVINHDTATHNGVSDDTIPRDRSQQQIC